MENSAVVLYVDHKTGSSRILAHLLEESGFKAVVSGKSNEALELCSRQPFDLALVKYDLPLMNGAALGKQMKLLQPDLPVIMISGHSTLPPDQLLNIDAHFGRGTSLDDLVRTMRMLTQRTLASVGHGQLGACWADST
jgi:DNA-binding response OmpR family regulator